MSSQLLTIRQMQTMLIEIRQSLDAASKLVAATEGLPSDLFEHRHALKALITRDKNYLSAELYEFLTLLNSYTFAGSPSIFSRQGNVLRAYALAKQVMPELLLNLKGVGEIDTLYACGNLITGGCQGCEFSFVEFAQGPTPSIAIQGFWNPIADWPNMINEKLALGNMHPHIAIITGANKAGKSTSSAAIAQCIIMGQSLGIAPAQSCRFSPFTKVRTCFNAHGLVCDSQSLFSASVDFADTTLRECAQDKDSFIFVATDELFNSTESSKGEIINSQMALNLAEHSNCIALMATHFKEAIKLEAQLPKDIQNLKASAITQGDNTTYHLERGVSLSANTLELVKDSELIKRTGLV